MASRVADANGAGERDERRIVTVCGAIAPDELGVCMAHEHVLFDFARCPAEFATAAWAANGALADRDVEWSDRARLYRNPFAIKDNLRQTSIELAVDELECYRRAGGAALVEATPINGGRDALGLKSISEATGIHMVASTGFLTEGAHPAYVKEATAEELAQQLVDEIVGGLDGTEVRAGAISDQGTSATITDDEAKCLRAAAWASLDTDVAIGVHLDGDGTAGLEVVRLLSSEGVSVHRIILEHVDAQSGLDQQLALADAGCYVEFDTWGMEMYWGPPDYAPSCRDSDRAASMAALVRRGHRDQILVSQDVCMKLLLREYGGEGYSSFLEVGSGFLEREGLGADDMRAITIENPARAFSVRGR